MTNRMKRLAIQLLAALYAALTVVLYANGHPVWGTIFALITVDFLADAVLSFKKA